MSNTTITSSNNIISFLNKKTSGNSKPTNKENINEPTTFEEVEKHLKDLREYHIHETVNFILPNIFERLYASGFDPEENNIDVSKDAMMVYEVIKSLLMKIRKTVHPIQKLSEEYFTEDKNGYYDIKENFEINIKETEEVK